MGNVFYRSAIIYSICLYVNDVCTVAKLLKFVFFVEDTNMFHSHSHWPDLVSELNTELNKTSGFA